MLSPCKRPGHPPGRFPFALDIPPPRWQSPHQKRFSQEELPRKPLTAMSGAFCFCGRRLHVLQHCGRSSFGVLRSLGMVPGLFVIWRPTSLPRPTDVAGLRRRPFAIPPRRPGRSSWPGRCCICGTLEPRDPLLWIIPGIAGRLPKARRSVAQNRGPGCYARTPRAPANCAATGSLASRRSIVARSSRGTWNRRATSIAHSGALQ